MSRAVELRPIILEPTKTTNRPIAPRCGGYCSLHPGCGCTRPEECTEE